ncbi:FAD-binding oxidoreductase [Cellulomonas timonensis]|uniref:FAD-binding oxidoreductase n=1 Tax=Cellulomonas timonensis TaxID=1689271 RepID=UPI000836C342|nr:FAD-binding oxidoreductase [Cellulomonas timonensis]
MVDRASAGYDAARRALSASAHQPPAEPAAIARPANIHGVVEAVRTARREGLRLAVRSGGHSLSATHLRHGSLALDLRDLNGIDVDPSRGTAWVGPGTTVAQAAALLDASGWSFPIGHSPTVGLGGFLLAGGHGWNGGSWGAACERVVAVDVITADARRSRLTPDSTPDLLAVARGAGPAFPAVVVGLELRLVRGVPAIARRLLTVGGEHAAQLGAALDTLRAAQVDGLELTVFARRATRAGAPADGAVLTVAATAFGASPTHASRLLAPLADLPGTGSADAAAHLGLASMVATLPRHEGDALWSDHVWTNRPWAELLPEVVQAAAAAPSDRSSILVTPAPASDPGIDAVHRPQGATSVSAYAHWRPGATDAGGPGGKGGEGDARSNAAWARAAVTGEGPHPRRYVGEADLTLPGRVEECLTLDALDRVRAAREQLDPGRLLWSALDPS